MQIDQHDSNFRETNRLSLECVLNNYVDLQIRNMWDVAALLCETAM
jgi:hypothetical protein